MADEKTKPEKKQAEKSAPKEAQTPSKKEVKAFVVCEGKNITSKRGILSPGDEVTVAILSGGQSSLDALVKGGYVK